MSELEPSRTPGQAADEPADELIDLLRSRVARRRAAGDYPEGLEEELEEHFRRIAFHKVATDPDGLREAVSRVDERRKFTAEVPAESSVPGGEILHRALNKALARQGQLIVDQLQDFADVVHDALALVAAAVQNPNVHVHADLVGRLDAVLERLDRLERAMRDVRASELERRVELLERALEHRT